MNNDIYNSMFHKGCWLYGADPDLSMYYFSLLDPAFYPPCVKIRDEHLLHEAVKRFYHKLHLYSVGKNFNGWVPDDHKELSRCLMDILNIVRNDVSFTHHLRTAICPRREAQPLLTDEEIPVNDRPTVQSGVRCRSQRLMRRTGTSGAPAKTRPIGAETSGPPNIFYGGLETSAPMPKAVKRFSVKRLPYPCPRRIISTLNSKL